MAFCRYCGGSVSEDAVFCGSCGKRLREKEDNPSYQMQQGLKTPQGAPIQQGGQMPQGYPMQQGGQMPQGYTMYPNGQMSQGYTMPQGNQNPQWYKMPQSGQYSTGVGVQMGMYSNNGEYVQSAPVRNEPPIEVEIEGDMGQILKAYNDYFIIETTDEFEEYESDARKIYQTKGASENDKGVLEDFADVGKEIGSVYGEAFAMFGEAFSSTYAEYRKKKKGVLTIPVGERREYYAGCAFVEGINIGQEKRGYISIKTKVGNEILFFFDGRDEDIDEEVTEVFNEVLQPKIFGQTVDHNVTVSAQNGSTSIPQQMVGMISPTIGGGDKVEQIKRIKELLDTGAISKREFARMKKEILKK